MSAEGQIFTIENLCKLLHMSGKKTAYAAVLLLSCV